MLLVSDLDDDQSDLPSLTQALLEYRIDGTPIGVVGLSPDSRNRTLFARLLGSADPITTAPVEEQTLDTPPPAYDRRQAPVWLAAAAGVLLLLLALNELWLARVAWRSARTGGAAARAVGGLGVRPVPVALAVLALSAAALLGAAAHDVGRLDERVARGDAQYPGGGRSGDLWRRGDGGLVAVPESLVEVDDDLALRRALRLVRTGREGADPTADATTLARLHSQAEEALLDVLRVEDDPARRALAANALGILLFEDAQVSEESAAAFTGRSLEAFRSAIKTDPTAAVPKTNLERMLGLLRPAREPRSGGGGGEGEDEQEAVAGLPSGQGW